MGMEKFYSTVRKQFGLEREKLKQEVKQEAIDELREELEEEISYIEAQMKEHEQLVAEVNHFLSTIRKERVKSSSSSSKPDIKMEKFKDDLEPLKNKLKELEKSMEERLQRQKALSG